MNRPSTRIGGSDDQTYAHRNIQDAALIISVGVNARTAWKDSSCLPWREHLLEFAQRRGETMRSRAKSFAVQTEAVARADDTSRSTALLATRYNQALIRFFRRRSTSLASDAEDLAQEVFLRLIQRGQTEHVVHMERYVFQVASSVLIDRARHVLARRGANHLNFEEGTHASETTMAPDRLLEAREELSLVRDALERMPERARDAFLLHRLEGLTYMEIGERLRVSVSSVEKYIMRALEDITRSLGFPAVQRRKAQRRG
jgi:RNA polymerase sigma factor (sigma-70 family)